MWVPIESKKMYRMVNISSKRVTFYVSLSISQLWLSLYVQYKIE